jgi:hemerythrin-like domain-containing protein
MNERDPLSFLQSERDLIRSVIESLERYAALVQIGNEDPEDLARFGVFFREFVAALHHRSKVALAFAALPQLSREARMRLKESHQREQVQLMAILHLAMTTDPRNDEQRSRLAGLLTGFCSSQREQITAERRSLYPALKDALAGRESKHVTRIFQESLSHANFAGQYDWLIALGTSLAQKYPDSPA